MSAPTDPTGLDLDTDGPGAPPRVNGGLVFTAPWQSRIFGATMRLRERGVIDGEEFRHQLIAEIASHAAALADPDDYDYWGCWQRALEALLARQDVVSTTDLATATARIAARPPDH